LWLASKRPNRRNVGEHSPHLRWKAAVLRQQSSHLICEVIGAQRAVTIITREGAERIEHMTSVAVWTEEETGAGWQDMRLNFDRSQRK
jgi:hypothetical protein